MGRAAEGKPKKLTSFLSWQNLNDEDRAEEEAPTLGPAEIIARQIWNLLGGCDWAGFDIACALYGVRDPHEMALLLAAIREEQATRSNGP